MFVDATAGTDTTTSIGPNTGPNTGTNTGTNTDRYQRLD